MKPLKTYGEKLKDPRWQKKRLEVFQRDKFTCQSCFSDIKTLHVHHLIYQTGKEPWEYEIDFLLTLCEGCHEEIEISQVKQTEMLIILFKTRLKDSFIRGCYIDILNKITNIHDFIYTLWECLKWGKEGEVVSALDEIFIKADEELRNKQLPKSNG